MRIIAIELPTPYPVGPVNAYLLPGPPITLVDCGPKSSEAQAALEAGLRTAGVGFADIRRLIITHGHIDHFGLAATVAAAGGAEVCAHPLDTPGHGQGHICLRWDDALIAGDLLLEEISPNPVIEFDTEGRRLRMLPAYLRSLRRVAALAPAIAYPGHGEPITTPVARVHEILDHQRGAQKSTGRDAGPPVVDAARARRDLVPQSGSV